MGQDKRKSTQPADEGLTPLLVPLQSLQNLLTHFQNQGVIIGGIAASLLGVPRYTVDLDAVFLLDLDNVPHLLQVAKELGIQPRIPDVIPFARKNRVLLRLSLPTTLTSVKDVYSSGYNNSEKRWKCLHSGIW